MKMINKIRRFFSVELLKVILVAMILIITYPIVGSLFFYKTIDIFTVLSVFFLRTSIIITIITVLSVFLCCFLKSQLSVKRKVFIFFLIIFFDIVISMDQAFLLDNSTEVSKQFAKLWFTSIGARLIPYFYILKNMAKLWI